MHIAVSIPTNTGADDPVALTDLAVLAEDLEFESIWTSEHMMHVSYVHARLGDRPYFHPLAALSHMAARTSRIRIGTSILVLPFHHPFELAKYAATLDHFSAGRVTLGVGVGNVEEEFDAMNVPWRQRGSITTESIKVMQALWTQELASFEGKHWTFSGVRTSPKPVQKPSIPIWVGGNSEAAMRRAARLGEGWHPSAIGPKDFGESRLKAVDILEEHGRDVSDFAFCVRLNVGVGESVTTEGERRAFVDGNDPSELARELEAYQEAGVTHCILAPNSTDLDATAATLRNIGRDVLPSFR